MQVVEHGKHIARKLEFIYVRAFCFNQRKYPVELSLLSSKICWIYYHYHTLLKLSIHPFRHPASEIVVAFRLSDDACLRHLAGLLYCVCGRCMEERYLRSLCGGFPVVQTTLN